MNHIHHCRSAVYHLSLTALVALAGAATLLLLGCGGAPLPQADVTPAAAKATPPVVGTESPVLGAEPSDPGARTRQGLYLTTAQAQALAHRLDDRLVTVQAQCCGPEAAELDVLMAFGVQAAANLPNDAAFVVSGSDLRQAAAVANRLADLGAKQVHLVTR